MLNPMSEAAKPVGLEVITFVTITTLFVNGKEVAITSGTATSTNFVFASAVAGSPCYACLFATSGLTCPTADHNKFVVYTSSCTGAASSLYTAPSAVLIPCPTCASTTLGNAAITPGAAMSGRLSSLGFVPATTIVVGGGSLVQGSATVNGQVIPTAVAFNNNGGTQAAGPTTATVKVQAAGAQSAQASAVTVVDRLSTVTSVGIAQATLATSTLAIGGSVTLVNGNGTVGTVVVPSASKTPAMTLFTGSASSKMVPTSGTVFFILLGSAMFGLAHYL